MTVVVTGTGWIGGGIGSIAGAMHEMLGQADLEIHMSVFSFSSRADLPLAAIGDALDRGVEVRLVIDHLGAQVASVRRRLTAYAENHRHFYLYDFVGTGELHAKLLVCDRQRALVGSPNLSHRGLMTGHELAVIVDGPDAAQVAIAVDRLMLSTFVNRVEPATRRP